MELRSNGMQDPFVSDDVKFGGQNVYFGLDEVYTSSDGRVFASGVMTNADSLAEKTFFIEVNDPDFAGFADISWKDQKALTTEARMDAIFQGQFERGQDAFTFVDAVDADAIAEEIKQKAVVPEPVVAPEPEGPRSANLEADKPINIASYQGDGPELLEGVEVNGQKGDLVIHDIEFGDGKPYLTGTFAVGDDVREFAVAIEGAQFPDVTQLTTDDLKHLTSSEVLQNMLGTAKHELVLSQGEAFANKAAVFADIDVYVGLQDLKYNLDASSFVNMGQEFEGFASKYRAYLDGSPNADDMAVRFAVLDGVGIEDQWERQRLAHASDGLKDFINKVNVPLEDRGARGAVEAMAASLEPAQKAARMARFAAGVAVVGSVATTAAAASSVHEGMTLTDLPDMQLEAKDITSDQHQALVDFHANTTAAQLADAAAGAADQFVIPSVLVTISVELATRDELTTIANEHNIPEYIYQMHSRSMFGGHTASHDAVLDAADELPRTTEGQPEILHRAIELNQTLHAMKLDLNSQNSTYAGLTVPPEQQARMDALGRGVSDYTNALVAEMDSLMRDPQSVEAFLNLMSVDDRMDFVKALAAGDPNLASHPVVAEATREFSGRGGTKMHAANVREAKAELSADGGAGLNDYIISRILPETAVPEEAPNTAWDEELVAQYYNPETLHEIDGMAQEEFARASVEGLGMGHAPQLDVTVDPDAALIKAEI